MGAVRNLTQAEARERARLVEVTAYDVTLDLTLGTRTFLSITEVRFGAAVPGKDTFVEVAALRLHRAVLNGRVLDTSGWDPGQGLALTDLAAENHLVVSAEFEYSHSGQGIHRVVDPADDEVYLYSQFQPACAQRAFACFDQPDLKAVYTWHATVPARWTVVSNAAVRSVDDGAVKTVHFERSARMAPYVTALCAGPYHQVRMEHDGIDLGLFCRRSMADHLEADELFEITRQGLDFFHERFGCRYPLPKYDQLWVPEFNAGAMENFGCVTHSDAIFLFRSAITDFEREQRAVTILHELAHMWFGNLVTMRWWDDLWLNESFAEWASHWCAAHATRFTDAWTTFLSLRKNWGYSQDQLSSTHPVYSEMHDVEAVAVNFDGITYAKGASVVKQLVAYVGLESFVAGLRAYFGRHAWQTATFADLLSALQETSGRDLSAFAAAWLKSAQVNTLRPVVSTGTDGRYTAVKILQEAPESHPALRPHRLGIGLYDLDDGVLVRRNRLELDVAGRETAVTALTGVRAPDVLLLNDDDLTYAKLRLDERSMAAVVHHLGTFESSLPRALCWAATWDMTRDGEMATRDYLALVSGALPRERDVTLVSVTLRQAALALGQYADPGWSPSGWALLAGTARSAIRAAEPGGGLQLAWARAFVGTARGEEDLCTLRDWLAGTGVPEGLALTGELRWQVIQALVANDAIDPAAISVKHAADRTSAGDAGAATATALIPSHASKSAVWEELTTDPDLPNWRARALTLGFQHPAQVSLTAPFMPLFFSDAANVWKIRDSDSAADFLTIGYPVYQVSAETVTAATAWLAEEGHPVSLRRLVTEGNDRVLRAQRARRTDRSARES
ncbi:aminopeptidase N [Sphaerisporangium perillae]|uniref:aminopeptidase N n=1 Tax=Sphaerisporangium perillae TaxID=2935860 RepID=UPI00200C4B15|nr:aminopeptidase N [Sphaerisporangium perillae]